MFRTIAMLSLVGCIAFGCQSQQEAPREIAHKYLAARLSQQFDQAALYLSPESQEHLTALESLSLEFEAFTVPSYRILTVEQTGSQALVTYQINGTDQDQLTLMRKESHWQIHLTDLSVPDAGLLYQELSSLEREEALDLDLDDLNLLLMEDETPVSFDLMAAE